MISTQRKRVLIAKPGLDGHDRGARVVASALRDVGFEVIYAGLHQSPRAIVAAARDEDVQLVGLSVLSGSHLAFTKEVRRGLDDQGLSHIHIVVGGILPDSDHEALLDAGASAVFPTNTNLNIIPDAISKVLETDRGS